MKKQYSSQKHNLMPLFTVLVMLCILLLTIGFSAFQASMEISNISAVIRAHADIRVTGIAVANSTNGASSSSEEYNVKSITSYAYLPYQDSTITYNIQITNIGNVMQGIYSIDEIYKIYNVSTGAITNTDSGLEIKNAVTLKEALCDDTDNSQCKLGSVTTLAITIGYASNGFDNTNKNHAIELDFDFRRVFGITYSGFSSVSGLATQMIYGDTKTVTFTNTTGVPSSVSVSGASGSYTSPTLTLSNITITAVDENIVVTRQYSITYSGFSGDTSGLISSISPTGGTITFDSTSGIPTSVTVTGATGSYDSSTHILALSNITGNITITATNSDSGGGQGTPESPYHDDSTQTYDPNDVPANSTIVYTAVDGAPQVSTDEAGKITSFEYTDASSANPITITSNSTVETGFIPFDGTSDWELNMRYKWKWADNVGNRSTLSVPLSCMDWDNGTLVSGFGIRHYASKITSSMTTPKTNLRFNVSINDESTTRYIFNTNSSGRIYTDPMDLSVNIRKVGSTITAKIKANGSLKYNPTKDSTTSGVSTETDKEITITWQDNSISEVDIRIGGYVGSDGIVTQKANIEVLEFSVHKITSN